MKKGILLGLAVMLSACGSLNIAQGFDMTPNITAPDVAVSVKKTVDSSGNVTGYENTLILTDPAVTFYVKAQSVGFTVKNVDVEVLDSAGARYGDADGLYRVAFTTRVTSGFNCAGGTDDQCVPANKTATSKSQSVGSIPLLKSVIAREAANNCTDTGCPNLHMKVTFNGVDDAGRTQVLTVDNVPVQVRITSIQ